MDLSTKNALAGLGQIVASDLRHSLGKRPVGWMEDFAIHLQNLNIGG